MPKTNNFDLIGLAAPLYGLTNLSFAPWFYMFLVGVLLQRNFETARDVLAGRFIALLAAYCVVGLIAARVLHWKFDNSLNPLLFVGLRPVTFAGAFFGTALSDRLLRRNDLSYGVYLYHAPVINLLLVTGIAAAAFGGHGGNGRDARAGVRILPTDRAPRAQLRAASRLPAPARRNGEISHVSRYLKECDAGRR